MNFRFKDVSLHKALPKSLWFLLQAALVSAQTKHQLSINSLSSFSASSLAGSSAFSLPSSSQLSVSVAICSGTIQSTTARFYVTNNSAINVPSSTGGQDVFNIPLNEGFGNWTGPMLDGGTVAVEGLGQSSFEIGISNGGVMHEVLNVLPLLGDTTSSQALLFSPPFSPPIAEQPTYPNYTIPPANLSMPTPPSSPNFTLVLSATSSSLTGLPQTGCSLLSAPQSGLEINQDLWLRDEQGWRSQWLMGNLSPITNYTVYVIQDQTKVSGPIYFATKSAAFACPLVYSLPFCPSTAYAVPLPPPAAPNLAYNSTTLPSDVSDPLLQYMTNFTTMLLTFACGRGIYSPLQTCADCQRAYRRWLCSVSFTRCSEASPNPISSAYSAPVPISALVPQPSGSSQRNPNLPPINSVYDALLPCLGTCNAVDRACPYFLGIQCPLPEFNAAASYGVGYIDDAWDDEPSYGSAGGAQDRWGNVWCNGS